MGACSAPVHEHSPWLLNHRVKLSTSPPQQPRVERSTSKVCFLTCGQHVNIHLRSDSTGAIGVASRRGLQRLRHLDVRFLWLQAEVAAKRVRISKVPGPENVADANTKPADRRSLEF